MFSYWKKSHDYLNWIVSNPGLPGLYNACRFTLVTV